MLQHADTGIIGPPPTPHPHSAPLNPELCNFPATLSDFMYMPPRTVHTLTIRSIHFCLFLGVGAVYGYDAVGSFERVRVACAGGGLSIMQPVLDRLDAAEPDGRASEGGGGGKGGGQQQPVVAVGLEEALALVRRAFVAGGERDISLGDEVEIVVLTREGQRRERLQLKSH